MKIVRVTHDNPPAFRPLIGVYEPSAIQQLADGRFVVVEDEACHPFSLVTLDADGRLDTNALTAGFLQMFSDFANLDDLR